MIIPYKKQYEVLKKEYEELSKELNQYADLSLDEFKDRKSLITRLYQLEKELEKEKRNNKYSTEYLAILVWLYGIDKEKYNKVVEDICIKIYDDYEWKSQILGYDFLCMQLSENNKYADELFDLFHQESED
tara:strand:+ start:16 stop:408 length:393 start_codon:yes stop_codon:yes gene_type:complete